MYNFARLFSSQIWDTDKEQLQIEFTDITSIDETNLCMKTERGNLSVDYTCMKWVYMDRKVIFRHKTFVVSLEMFKFLTNMAGHYPML